MLKLGKIVDTSPGGRKWEKSDSAKLFLDTPEDDSRLIHLT